MLQLRTYQWAEERAAEFNRAILLSNMFDEHMTGYAVSVYHTEGITYQTNAAVIVEDNFLFVLCQRGVLIFPLESVWHWVKGKIQVSPIGDWDTKEEQIEKLSKWSDNENK